MAHDALAVRGEGACRTLFLHAGLRASTATQYEGSVERINLAIREQIERGAGELLDPQHGPLWFRGYARPRLGEEAACAELSINLARELVESSSHPLRVGRQREEEGGTASPHGGVKQHVGLIEQQALEQRQAQQAQLGMEGEGDGRLARELTCLLEEPREFEVGFDEDGGLDGEKEGKAHRLRRARWGVEG